MENGRVAINIFRSHDKWQLLILICSEKKKNEQQLFEIIFYFLLLFFVNNVIIGHSICPSIPVAKVKFSHFNRFLFWYWK